MLPHINILDFSISMYGLMVVVGLAVGILIAVYLPVRRDLPKQDIFFAACFGGLGLYAGAKILFWIITLPTIIQVHGPGPWTMQDISDLFSYGFVFYGGLFGIIIGILVYAKMFKISFWHLMDSLVLAVPLVHAFGRFGCFFAGCCYGCPTDPPWGVFFRPDSAAPSGIALFPVQIWEAGLNIVLFAILFVYSRKPRGDHKMTGLYLLGYAIIRFSLEFFRADTIRGIFLGMGTSQWISIVLVPIGLYLLLSKKKSVVVEPTEEK